MFQFSNQWKQLFIVFSAIIISMIITIMMITVIIMMISSTTWPLGKARGVRTCFSGAPAPLFQLQISGLKMKAEILKLLKLFEEFAESGATVTLTFSTRGSSTTAKLHLEATSSLPSPTSTDLSPLVPAPGRRCCQRGAWAGLPGWASHHQCSAGSS